MIKLTPEEQRLHDSIIEVMAALSDMGLKYNAEEEVFAIHILQGFLKQHVLNRLDPVNWSDWFGENDQWPSS